MAYVMLIKYNISRLMEARQLSLKSGRSKEEIPKIQRLPSDNSFQRLDEYVLAVERAQLGHTRHGMLRKYKDLLALQKWPLI